MHYKYIKLLQQNPRLLKAIDEINQDEFNIVDLPDVFTSHKKILTNLRRAFEKTGKILSDDYVIEMYKQYFDNSQAYEYASYDYQNDSSAEIEIIRDELRDIAQQGFALKVLQKTEAHEQLTDTSLIKLYSESVPNNKPVIEYSATLTDPKGAQAAYDMLRKKLTELSVPTGFPQLNAVLQGGGFKPGSTYCIQGLTGYGKSIFTCNIARAAVVYESKNVLFISTEMDQAEVLDRIMRAETKKTESQQETAIAEWINVLKRKIGNLHFEKVHPGITTVRDIEHIIQKQDVKPDILIIDYADQLTIEDKKIDEYNKHGIVFDGLKRLAGEYYIPILTATQTNRTAAADTGGTKEYVGLTATSDSVKKQHALDTLFGISQTVEDRSHGLIHLDIAKNRGGVGQGKVTFSINYDYLRLGSPDIDVWSSGANVKEPRVTPHRTTKEDAAEQSRKSGAQVLGAVETNRRGKI